MGVSCILCRYYAVCPKRPVSGFLSMCAQYKQKELKIEEIKIEGVNTFCTIVDEVHKYDDALKEVRRMYADENNRFKTEYDKLAKRYTGGKAIVIGKDFIKDVIFNPPVTIVFWSDNTKTVVKCCADETFDPEKGIAMAFFKKMFGNTGSYNNIIKKRVENKYYKKKETPGNDLAFGYSEHSIKIDLPKDLTSEELDYMKQTIVRKTKLSLSTVKLLRYSSYAKREKCKSSDSK